jgi:hypothetical protein
MKTWIRSLGSPALEGMIESMEKNKINLRKKLVLIESRQATCARELVSRDIQKMIDGFRKEGD